MKLIVGAGLAGLLAAHAWPNTVVIEQSGEPDLVGHKALMRLRTDKLTTLTGIDLKPVTVRKGIWFEGEFVSPNIRVSNLYSHKVLGMGLDRSIWNIDPVTRYIAPDNLHEQLLNAVYKRVEWNTSYDTKAAVDPIISTAPLNAMAKVHDLDISGLDFKRAPIKVQRWRLPQCSVHQTIYFPADDTPLYRASITGDILIAEMMVDEWDYDYTMPIDGLLEKSFGISLANADPLGTVEQKYGKIAEIGDKIRKQLLFELTHIHGVYSLGRFATWRNILLDDVCDDIAVIKRISKEASPYDLRRQS